MNRLIVLGLCAGLTGAVWGFGPAAAQDAPAIAKQRQDLMKQQAADMGAVKGFIDGKADRDKAEAAAADLIGTTTRIPDVFPTGTGGPNPDGKYATKPEIWSDWNGFLAQRDVAKEKAGVLLAATKEGDKAKVQEAFADLGKNGCGGCHGKFREELKK